MSKHYEMEDGVPLPAGGGRRSSKAQTIRDTQPHNRSADVVPGAAQYNKAPTRTLINKDVGVVAQKTQRGSVSLEIDNKMGHAENHRRDPSTVAKGAQANPQVKGAKGGHTRTGETDVLGSC